MLKRVDTATYDFIESVDAGKPLTSYQVYDLKADGVAYSTSGGFIDDITGDIDKFKEQIISGEIKVPTKP
jgi:basic membrane protein A